MRTRFTEAFGVEHPVACAPMAYVTGGKLAAAVSKAGGLGVLGGGYAGTVGGEPDLAAEIAIAGGERIGIGFITWALAKAPRMLEVALQSSPACLFLSFGDPRPFAAKIHRAGVKLVCQAQSLAHVDQALEAGAAAIVAQGCEAGGHGAKRSTLPFVPEVADYLARRSPQTLLLAAGGIADGRGLAAALMLGADAVLVGTRFWSTLEALTPPAMTERAIGATGDDTVRTTAIDALRGVPWPGEFSFRVLANELTDAWAGREGQAAENFGALAADYADARNRGDLSVVVTVAGEAVGLVRDRPNAASVVESMVRDAEKLLSRGIS
ncbi:MAG TPA: nitronate monooxygenase [Usitatibacter sp.]|nr:nitronate monooxygenase [Usitatibacter sp.]